MENSGNVTSNDETNKRPKRNAAQRANAYLYHEHASVLCWSEEKDLKKALLASLQEAKRNSKSYKNNNNNDGNSKTCVSDNIDNSSNGSKQNTQSECKDNVSIAESTASFASNLSQSLARRNRSQTAQRKFAMGSASNSPMSTPVKVGTPQPTRVTQLFPYQRPKTEDFLTFLCLRGTPVLPPNLDFLRINNTNVKKKENGKTNSDSDTSMTDGDDYKHVSGACVKNSDRRGSGSSCSFTKIVNYGRSNMHLHKKLEYAKDKDNKRSYYKINQKCHDSNRNNRVESNKKHTATNTGPFVKHSHSKTNKSVNTESNSAKDINLLKQKYKEQRIAKKSNVSINARIKNQINVTKGGKMSNNNVKTVVGIQTRRSSLRWSNEHGQDDHSKSLVKPNKRKPKLEVKVKKPEIPKRVLRSHHHTCCTHSSQVIKLHQMNRKRRALSPIGIRPHKRKAKPIFSLVDFEMEDDSDLDSGGNLKGQGKKQKQDVTSDLKNVKTMERRSKVLLKLNERPKKRQSMVKNVNNRNTFKQTTKTLTIASNITKRVTRSAKKESPPKDTVSFEREKLIKQQIIEIEKKHKRLRRFPSDQSLHSSTSSSTSSESLPSSSASSSSSINIPRLTRSLEHLKRIRDIAAKLKKEQKKRRREEKKKMKNDEDGNDKKVGIKRSQRISKNKYVKSTNVKESKKLKDKQMKTKNKQTLTRLKVSNDRNKRIKKSKRKLKADSDSDTMITEESMTSNFDDMERASIVLQDMADEISTLDDVTNEVVHSVPDLVYGNKEHIQGLMTTEFSGAFSEETVSTASAILPSSSSSSYYIHHVDVPTQTRHTVDASTNTNEEDILECLSEETYSKCSYELSVGTQTSAENEHELKRFSKP